MTDVVANSQGVATGKFDVPAGVPTGNKLVRFVGSGGSVGFATYQSAGTLIAQVAQMERVTTVFVPPPPPPSPPCRMVCSSSSGGRTMLPSCFCIPVDPLAQSFSLQENKQIGGVELWFKAVGTTGATVQIRDVVNGFPGTNVLASKVLPASGITTNGVTRFEFDVPVLLSAGVEYAIAVLCDDADSEIAVAELGKWDATHSRWVTAQPYTVGVMFSSSNEVSWSIHQDRDMSFRLLAINPTQTSADISLGTASLSNATDMMILASAVGQSATETVKYEITLPGGAKTTVSAQQPISFASPVTGSVSIVAKLAGTAERTPILVGGVQAIAGTVASSATYISRAIPAGTNSTVRVVLDELVPSGASVSVDVKGIDVGDTWTSMPQTALVQIDNGWIEAEYQASGINETMVQVRITLTGTSAARPMASNLRVIVT